MQVNGLGHTFNLVKWSTCLDIEASPRVHFAFAIPLLREKWKVNEQHDPPEKTSRILLATALNLDAKPNLPGNQIWVWVKN